MTDRYILHYAPDNASLIIRLALEYRGLPYKTVLVDRAKGAQRSVEYRALNPNGLIPVLETPNGPLFETGAILLWLADTHGGLGPAPQDATRGPFLAWLFFVANTVHPALRMMFYPERYVSQNSGAQTAVRRQMRSELTTHFATLEQIAATGPNWFGGVQPTVLDFYVAACLRWPMLYPANDHHGWLDLAQFPALQRLCAKIETLPACAALQVAEGLGDTPFTAPMLPIPPEGSAT